MMSGFLRVVALVCLVSVSLVSAAVAQSRLLGDTYTFSATNFQRGVGVTEDPTSREIIDHGTPPVTLTFDGIAEVAGGIRVNERVFEWPGEIGGIPVYHDLLQEEADLLDWEFPGEVVEFSFETVDGKWLSSNVAAQSAVTLRDIDWRNSIQNEEPFFFETGFYFWYSVKGVPVTGYKTAVPDALLVGEHPFDPSVSEVVYIGYSQNQVNEISLPYEGGFDLTLGTSQLSEDASWALLAAAMSRPDLAGIPADGFHWGFLVDPPKGNPIQIIPGDFNFDSLLDEIDINLLTRETIDGTNNVTFDLNNDKLVNGTDRDIWVQQLKKTWYGDADLNGQFSSNDFVTVFLAGQYEDATPGNSTWETGDWNGDGDFGSADFVTAFLDGGYEAGTRPAVSAVPEPSSMVLLLLGGLALLRRRP